jgi:unsaturated rhamnogalacturonyl hydrolase
MIRTLICSALLSTAAPLQAAQNWNVGLTPNGVVIEARGIAASADEAPTILIIGGLSGNDSSVGQVTSAIRRIEDTPQGNRSTRIVAIPLANPDANTLVFPPPGIAYRDNIESHALWRWIGVHAPDQVLIVGDNDFGLANALSTNAVAGIGSIPARRVAEAELANIPNAVGTSEARLEIERRISRSPEQLAEELSTVYGQDFDQLTYLPGMALIGRLRMGHVADVEPLAAPYLERDNLARANSLTLAGHLVFAELAERENDDRYLDLIRRAADLGFNDDGEMNESMPFHGDMSDSFFMAGPLLAKTGKLTGDQRYFDMAARHIDFMRGLDLRADGLYRHSPLSEAAWSRGNAFPALGIALTLSDFPRNHADYDRIATLFRQHMEVLAGYQDADGMWHEVIDYPGAYAEYSSTAMIGAAMLRGIRNGWLDSDEFEPHVDAAWQAILRRTGSDGTLINVCESTNKQQTLDNYLDRAAILDRDTRGGGMALIFATEMAGME